LKLILLKPISLGSILYFTPDMVWDSGGRSGTGNGLWGFEHFSTNSFNFVFALILLGNGESDSIALII